MAKPNTTTSIKPEHVLVTLLLGSLVVLGQHFLAAEEESWLRRAGLWPS